MLNTLLGVKKNMTSTYDARGRRVGATVVEMKPSVITQMKSGQGKDGYNAIQLGYGIKRSVRKPQIGHAKATGIDQKIRWFREVRINENPSTTLGTIQPGTEIKLNQVFSIGDAVKVSGVSKGKGFAGVVKRHGFHGGPKTHGQSDRHRAPGSIGAGTTPGRVLKGKRMAGHMGAETVTVRDLEIVGLDKEKNLLIIKGGLPGATGGLLTITKLGRIKGYTPPPEEKPEEEEESSENSENLRKPEGQDSSESDNSDKTDTQISSEISKEEEATEDAKS
ncbi:MAG: 50S ribosomal protein L3 [Candidatus Daviesbacteria bacterium]|nr:MAG: 50S ribosomal protein L3 [Candidatus Daviesbacteria bacterium]